MSWPYSDFFDIPSVCSSSKGAVLELHIVDDAIAVPELFNLRDFLCKQFNYINEFRIAHLSNREKLHHLIYRMGKFTIQRHRRLISGESSGKEDYT